MKYLFSNVAVLDMKCRHGGLTQDRQRHTGYFNPRDVGKVREERSERAGKNLTAVRVGPVVSPIMKVNALSVFKGLKGKHQGDVMGVGEMRGLFLRGVEQNVDEINGAEGLHEIVHQGTVTAKQDRTHSQGIEAGEIASVGDKAAIGVRRAHSSKGQKRGLGQRATRFKCTVALKLAECVGRRSAKDAVDTSRIKAELGKEYLKLGDVVTA